MEEEEYPKQTELEQDLLIDKNNLDFECLDQPVRFMRWSVNMADATKQRNWAKRQVQITRSEKSVEIRKMPNKYNLEKITDASVAATLETLEEISKVENDYIELQRVVDIYSSAKEAFEQRKKMLELLTQLYLSGYYSRPKQESEAVTKMADVGTEDQKAALRLRMKK